MVEIAPFNGLRYNEEKSGPLSELIAPPYDVIRPNMQEELYARNSYNVVRLILGKQYDDDNESNSRYTRSAKDFADWQSQDILKEDAEPSFYVYSQEYTFNGKTHNRIGFFARVKLEDDNWRLQGFAPAQLADVVHQRVEGVFIQRVSPTGHAGPEPRPH